MGLNESSKTHGLLQQYNNADRDCRAHLIIMTRLIVALQHTVALQMEAQHVSRLNLGVGPLLPMKGGEGQCGHFVKA